MLGLKEYLGLEKREVLPKIKLKKNQITTHPRYSIDAYS